MVDEHGSFAVIRLGSWAARRLGGWAAFG